MDISEIRRQHLRRLMADRGASELAKQLGYRQSSFLSQMAGPNPTRGITEKTARAFETALGLAHGYFDIPDALGAAVQPSVSDPQMTTADMLAMVLAATRKVGNICEAEKVDLPPGKFASVLQLVLKDAADHGGAVREDHVKDVLELLK